jgi:hypothetical protein
MTGGDRLTSETLKRAMLPSQAGAEVLTTAYHKRDGAARMYEVDARDALTRFPDEWSREPWPAESEEDRDE